MAFLFLLLLFYYFFYYFIIFIILLLNLNHLSCHIFDRCQSWMELFWEGWKMSQSQRNRTYSCVQFQILIYSSEVIHSVQPTMAFLFLLLLLLFFKIILLFLLFYYYYFFCDGVLSDW